MSTPAFIAALEERVKTALIGIDDAVNTVFGGQDDITISARVGMVLIDHERGVCRTEVHGVSECAQIMLAKWLDDLQKDHCKLAIQGDIGRCDAALAKLRPYAQSELKATPAEG